MAVMLFLPRVWLSKSVSAMPELLIVLHEGQTPTYLVLSMIGRSLR
jgi:hypothetical protein